MPAVDGDAESGCASGAGDRPWDLQLRVTRADNGYDTPLEELVYTGERSILWSVDERMRLVKRRLSGSISTGRCEASSIRLSSGRALEVSSSLSVRKLTGWSPIAELAVGDRIAAVRRLPQPEQTTRMHDSEVILLAHMIGDGSCVKRQPIRYASIDEANLMAVTIAAAHFGVTAIRDDYAAARATTLRLPSPYRLARGKRNPIAEWLDTLGLFGLRSYEKFVPAAVFALPDEQVALFLRHLWATDGSVRWDSKTAQGRVYYASTSRRLIDDVLQLLLRIGVQGRITRTSKGGYRDCWHLTIDRAANQVAFLNKVGVHGERGVKAKEVVAQLLGRVRRPGTDTIPVEVWGHVKSLLKERNWSDQQFAVATNTRFDGPMMWTHAPGRSRLHRISNVLDDSVLHDLATNDVYWDKVAEITSLGSHDIADLSGTQDYPVVVRGVLVQPLGD
ncbi:endonuclease [Mycolicibacterium novocastrense]|uniref:Endonuclease n=2 Tax=Mycolicibacterium novocastrense TaxID=59813 RepID=A0AAW5SP51_MYCNV|nr:LAGLIDADG family homing endonuclease [Mycolicibacterium novocastrense]MCV7025518.1 endonuclease [Mycolicibacterium novocastrense]